MTSNTRLFQLQQVDQAATGLAFAICAFRFGVCSAFHNSFRCCRFNQKSAVFPKTVGSVPGTWLTLFRYKRILGGLDPSDFFIEEA